MKILITGGTGLIGARLALRCLERGDQVRILALSRNEMEQKNAQHLEAQGAEMVIGSILDEKLVFETLSNIDIVYHFAAAQHEANVSDQVFWDVNVKGTQNILEACVRADVKRLIHGSTIVDVSFLQTGRW